MHIYTLGLVPYTLESVHLANGDIQTQRTYPCWGIDIKCGKGTNISYGPWADRQRSVTQINCTLFEIDKGQRTPLATPSLRKTKAINIQ